MSPAKMTIGRDMRVPDDIVIQRPDDEIMHDVPGYVQHLKYNNCDHRQTSWSMELPL